MQFLPFALTNLWSTLIEYPFAILGTVLFAFALHRLANRCNCYGLPRNVVFGATCGAVAYALLQLYVYFSRNYNLHSIVLGELIGGYETAIVLTVIRRLVFSQRPPKSALPAEASSPDGSGVP